MTISVHDIEPGQLGLVAHKLRTTEPNFLVPQQDPKFLISGQPWKWAGHIEHGTFVLIIERLTDGTSEFDYYKVIWGEEVGWINAKHLINPRMNADES